MRRAPGKFLIRLLLAACSMLTVGPLLSQTSVRSVRVLPSKDAVEIEVEASDRVVPQTRVLSRPDRLVIDFPNSVPGSQLRNQSVNLGEVKDLRFGLFQAKPPITRLVLDLKSAQSFQIFPYGRTVMIKVTGSTDAYVAGSDAAPGPGRPGLVTANYTNRKEAIQTDSSSASAARSNLDVTFRDGMLSIRSDKATLSEVLYAVQQHTGAEVSISPGAGQERVVTDLGPAPAAEVLAHLLNGSRFNFLIVNGNGPGQLDKIILTPRPDGAAMPLPPMTQSSDSDDQPSLPPEPGARPVGPGPRRELQPQTPPDGNAPPNENPQQQ